MATILRLGKNVVIYFFLFIVFSVSVDVCIFTSSDTNKQTNKQHNTTHINERKEENWSRECVEGRHKPLEVVGGVFVSLLPRELCCEATKTNKQTNKQTNKSNLAFFFVEGRE